MRDAEIGRIARALRRRRRWRQQDVALRVGVHRSVISLIERGELARLTVGIVRRCLEALEAQFEPVVRWRGADLDRLLDEEHARLQAGWAQRLARWIWEVIPEASFNYYGDRGRVDLLCWHKSERILLVGEIKSELADAQGTLGPLDVKLRVAIRLAAERGWGRPASVVPLLVVRESPTTRRRLLRLEPLFSRFDLRGRAATRWLRQPSRANAPNGLLILSDLPFAGEVRGNRIGKQRVRLMKGAPSRELPPQRRPSSSSANLTSR